MGWRMMKHMLPIALAAAALGMTAAPAAEKPELPEMQWADDSSGRPFSKDPSVIRFKDRYLMYDSLPGAVGGGMGGLRRHRPKRRPGELEGTLPESRMF